MTVAGLLIDTLVANGVSRMFGNPGTTELALVRECRDTDKLDYIVAPSGIAAAAMADGYGRARRGLSAVNLHAGPGLGNAMGALYTAATTNNPVLAVIGQQDTRHLHVEPPLYGDLAGTARTVLKAAFEMPDAASAGFIIRRAIRTAMTAPMGPVALICPMDVMEQECPDEAVRVTVPTLGGVSRREAAQIASFLHGATSPAIVAADEVYWDGACDRLEQVAEATGAAVYIAPFTGVLPISSVHPRSRGFLPPSTAGFAARLEGHDRILFLGGYRLRSVLYSEGQLAQAKMWLGSDPRLLAEHGEYELAKLCDIGSALDELFSALSPREHAGQRPQSAARPSIVPDGLATSAVGMHPTVAVREVMSWAVGATIIDESGLSNSDVRALMDAPAGAYFSNGSGGLGWGLPAAVGAGFARDGRVVAIIGDGSALYSAEVLWTATRYDISLDVILLANGRYATLDAGNSKLTKSADKLAHFSLEPAPDFGGLARLYHWEYERVEDAGALSRLLKANSTGRRLIEVAVDPDAVPVTADDHF